MLSTPNGMFELGIICIGDRPGMVGAAGSSKLFDGISVASLEGIRIVSLEGISIVSLEGISMVSLEGKGNVSIRDIVSGEMNTFSLFVMGVLRLEKMVGLLLLSKVFINSVYAGNAFIVIRKINATSGKNNNCKIENFTNFNIEKNFKNNTMRTNLSLNRIRNKIFMKPIVFSLTNTSLIKAIKLILRQILSFINGVFIIVFCGELEMLFSTLGILGG
jgi:hypothetical protein